MTHYPFGGCYLSEDVISKDKEYYFWHNNQYYRLNKAVILTEMDMQGNARLVGFRGEGKEWVRASLDSFCVVEPYDGSNSAIFLPAYEYLRQSKRKVGDITNISLELIGAYDKLTHYYVKVGFPDITLTILLNDFFKNGYQRLPKEWDEKIGILLEELVGRLLKKALLSGEAMSLNVTDANTAVTLLRSGEVVSIYDLRIYHHPSQDEDRYIIDWNHDWYDVDVGNLHPLTGAINALIRYCE